MSDLAGLLLDNQMAVNPGGGADFTGYAQLLPTLVRSFTLGGGMTEANIADSEGLIDAAEFTTTSNTSLAYAGLTTGNIVLGDPVWVEFDLKQGSSASATSVEFRLQYTSSGAIHFKRILTPPANWRRYRFLTYLREATITILFQFSNGGSATKFQVGRCVCYHAREPLPYSIHTTSGQVIAATKVSASTGVYALGSVAELSGTGQASQAYLGLISGTPRLVLVVAGAEGVEIDNFGGVMRFLSAASILLGKLDQGGALSSKNKMYPGTDGAAIQAACGIYAGTGVPSNANGGNGDYYFRSDGSSATTHVYFKSGGTWSGIA